MSSSNCCFLTCIQISQEASQVVWYSHFNEAEVDIFLELSCFFSDPTFVGNCSLDSSAFSKFSLNIWKFTVHLLLKPGLENFEHCFASMWDKCSCAVVGTFFGFAFGIEMKTNLFQSCGHYRVFQISWHIKCSTLTALSSRVWNGLAINQLLPLALFVVMLPKVCTDLTSYSRMSGSRWVTTSLWLAGSLRLFWIVFSCILGTSS